MKYETDMPLVGDSASLMAILEFLKVIHICPRSVDLVSNFGTFTLSVRFHYASVFFCYDPTMTMKILLCLVYADGDATAIGDGATLSLQF